VAAYVERELPRLPEQDGAGHSQGGYWRVWAFDIRSTSGSYQQLEYCTQYSETDFNFVSRILEESGIFYFFEHTDQDHKIILGDSRNAYQDCALSASVPYALNQKGAEGAYGAVVTEFNSVATMVSGMHSTSDYTHINFARSDAPVKTAQVLMGRMHSTSISIQLV